MRDLRLLPALAVLLAATAIAGAQSVWNTTLIHGDGSPTDRLDIVIMGDGYTAAEIPLFHTHAANFVTAWTSEAPNDRYKNFVNIWRVDVESAQSGADKPGPCWTTPTFVNTELDATYCTGGTMRCVTTNTSKVMSTAALNVPGFDEVIVAVNDAEYGGCANSVSNYAAANSSGLQVAVHELGHSIFGLADEYDYGASSSTYTGNELGQVNVSIHDATSMAALQTKWHYWIGTEGVSAFEGARYYQFGIFRPKSNCKMRSNGQPFCPVCREATLEHILGMYHDPIAVSPSPSGGPYQNATIFSLSVPAAGAGAAWVATWSLDGTPVLGGTVSVSGGVATYSYDGSSLGVSGQHTLTVSLQDTTSWYQKATPLDPFDDVSWSLSDVNADFDVTVATLGQVPTKAGELGTMMTTVTNGGLTSSPSVRIGYYASNDPIITTSDALMEISLIPALPPGTSTTSTREFRVPTTVTNGLRYFGVIVDDLNQVTETNESNNAESVAGGPFPITADLNLTADAIIAPLTTPVLVNLDIAAGPAHAGKGYYMVPSLTSSFGGPGSWLGFYVGFVNLTFDDLTDVFVTGAVGAPYFQDFSGTLDANGEASASFLKPALPAGLPPASIYFAYAVLEPGVFGFLHVPLISRTASVLIF
ncbi:MAG: M64 family metallopeptidase [Planctomycetota bacterium]